MFIKNINDWLLERIKSPLQYPGGKSRAVNIILPYIPSNRTICSPFLGGGSIELELCNRGNIVYAYDVYEPLVNFWQQLLGNKTNMIEFIKELYPFTKEQFKFFQKTFNNISDKSIKAAVFYVLNRTSFLD